MQVYDLAQTRAAHFAGTMQIGRQRELDAQHNPLPVDLGDYLTDPEEVDEDDAVASHYRLMASFARTASAISAPVAEPALVQAEQPAPESLSDYLPVDVVAAETSAEHNDDAIRFDRLVDLAIVEALLEKYGIALPPRSNRKDRKGRRDVVLTAISAILASALMAADAGRKVSVSFHRPHYSKRKPYLGSAYTHENIAENVRRLAAPGVDLLVLNVAGGGKNRTRGVQSTFWATDLLLEELAGVELKHDPELKAPLRLKDRNGHLLPFKHSKVTRAIMQDLNAINTWTRSFTVTLPGAERTPRGQYLFRKEVILDDGTTETVESVVASLECPQVYQVFSGDWDLHGRYYGPWQNIPSDWRRGLMINGMRTVELDYAALHPTILYAERGINITEEKFDPYAAPGYQTDEMRVCCKLALNIAINASSFDEAVGALMARKRLKGKKKWRLSRKRTIALLEAVIAHNARIADAICSDAGIRLMRTDSKIMREVLMDCMAAGIPALPVHDSVVAPARHKAQLKGIMEVAYCRVVGVLTPCDVKDSGRKVTQTVGVVPPAPVTLSVPATLAVSLETLSARFLVSRTSVPGAPAGRVSLIASLKTSRSCRPSSAPAKGVASRPSSASSETVFPARLSVISSLMAQNLPLEPVDASDVFAPMVSSQRRPADIWEGIPNVVHGKEDVGPDPYADLYGDVSAPVVRKVQPDPESEAYEAAKEERQREERRKARARWKDVVDQTLGRGRYRRAAASRSAAILLPTDPWGTLVSCSGSA